MSDFPPPNDEPIQYAIPDNVHVLVATPNFTNTFAAEVHVSHIDCCVRWTKWKIKFNWTIIGRTFVHFARTQACQVMMDGGFTHLFWVDDDAVIDPEILPRFLAHDKEVMIAPYPMRRPPYQIGILSSTTGNFHEHETYENMTIKDLNQGVIEVDGGGTHCMLVRRDVLEKHGDNSLRGPGYPPSLAKLIEGLSLDQRKIIDQFVGELPDESLSMKEEDDLGKPYFMMPKTGTEDMYWCYRVKKKGVKVWADTDVWANHVGFNPVITKEFTQRMEGLKMPQAGNGETVQIQPIGGVRNSGLVKINAESNLI